MHVPVHGYLWQPNPLVFTWYAEFGELLELQSSVFIFVQKLDSSSDLGGKNYFHYYFKVKHALDIYPATGTELD